MVFKLCSKAPWGQKRFQTPLREDAPEVPPLPRTPPASLPPFGPGPALRQDVAAKCRWGRGRRGGSCAGICILGTRRWELQVPAAQLPAPAKRRSLSSSFPRPSRLARGPERVPEMVPALPLPPCWGDTLEPLAQERVPRPGLAVAPSTEPQARPRVRLGLWAVHKAPLGLCNANLSVKDPPVAE